jgi:hypothetical protein
MGVDEEADDFAKQHLIKEDERVIALRNRLNALAELIEKTRGKEEDEDAFKEAEYLLKVARQALKDKDVEHGKEVMERCVDKVNKCSLQYRLMLDTFKATHKKIAESYEMAGDVTRANELLDKAKEMMMELKYDLAISLAIKSRIVADREKAKYSTLHAGITDWLE